MTGASSETTRTARARKKKQRRIAAEGFILLRFNI